MLRRQYAVALALFAFVSTLYLLKVFGAPLLRVKFRTYGPTSSTEEQIRLSEEYYQTFLAKRQEYIKIYGPTPHDIISCV
jgi:hypothetical protein